MDGQGTPDPVLEFWDTFIEDVEATAAEYREDGWEVLEVHPGDVEPQPNAMHASLTESEAGDGQETDDGKGPTAEDTADVESVETPADDPATNPSEERLGFDLLVPDSEFESLERFIDEGFTVTNYEAYRADRGGASFVLVVERDESANRAVCLPIHYTPGAVEQLESEARERGVVHTYLRPLSRRRVVTFSHDDPSSFFGGDADPQNTTE